MVVYKMPGVMTLVYYTKGPVRHSGRSWGWKDPDPMPCTHIQHVFYAIVQLSEAIIVVIESEDMKFSCSPVTCVAVGFVSSSS